MPKKTLSGKGLSQETHMQGKIQVVKQNETKKLRQIERKSRRKNTQYPKKGYLPSEVANSVTRKISLWLGENHKIWNHTHKSDLISNMIYK
jgi:ribosomal protein L44E